MRYAVIFTIIIGVIVFYIVFGHNGVLKYIELVNVRQTNEERIRQMEKEIAEKERELDLAKVLSGESWGYKKTGKMSIL